MFFTKDEAIKLEDSFEKAFGVEYLPGQFDQRRQGVIDTLNLVLDEHIDCKTATIYEFSDISDGFINYSDEEISRFLENKSLAMDFADLKMVMDYFKKENRDPNETEIKILDTYWSDHCRHTTFNTSLDIEFETKSLLDKAIKKSFDKYMEMRKELNIKNPIILMSFGIILSKYMKSRNEFDDLEISSEINACSVYVKVRVEKDGKEELEDYLLMFKNETHNHPTEIEPFGGISTCLGGAIRDPLSGGSYVYQAMRITGAGNILEKVDDTIEGKLP